MSLVALLRQSLAVAGAVVAAAPGRAQAFCGFFVAGSDAKLTNNASQVVLMRKGNRTVMTMSNNYQGPPENFAMVVPVPVVLQKEDVKTLPADVFDRVDSLSAPRLVEYWEQDPVSAAPICRRGAAAIGRGAGGARRRRKQPERPGPGRHDRGPVRRRRVRDPDPVGDGFGGPRDLAAPARSTASRRARPRRWRPTCATSRSSSSPRSTSRR